MNRLERIIAEPTDKAPKHKWPEGEVSRCPICETIRWQRKELNRYQGKTFTTTLYQVRGSVKWLKAAPRCRALADELAT